MQWAERRYQQCAYGTENAGKTHGIQEVESEAKSREEALQGKDVTKIWRMSRHSNVTNIILWYSRLANNSTLCQLSMFFKKIHYRIITCRSTYGTCAIFHLRHVTSSSCFHNLAERLATKQPAISLMSWCKVKQS